MGYSSAHEVHQVREALGRALELFQKDAEIPEEALGVAQNIARSVGALFEAEYASTELDGKTCVRNALGTLSQTLALLQDVKTGHAGVERVTESIADVISVLFPLTNRPSVKPEGSSGPAPANTAADSAASSGNARPSTSRPREAAKVSAQPSEPPPNRASFAGGRVSSGPFRHPSSGGPSSGAPATIPTSLLPPPAPIPTGERRRIEANLGAATQSNFYVGLSGEVAHGGVFLATYEVLPKDTSVTMLVTLPGGFEFECDAYVRFVRDPLDFASESEPGMGIQFENLSEEARSLVLRFVRKRPPIFYDV